MKTRLYLTLFILSIAIIGCSPQYMQVFEINSNKAKLSKDFFVYENDTIKISYSFWANHGLMAFSIYNKLDKPIYIDWKNSSFIYNSNKLNYWIDEQKTDYSSYYLGYYYKGNLLPQGIILNEGIQNTTSVSIKPERITFIPPKSN